MNNFDTIKANGKIFKLKVGELVYYATETAHYYFLDQEYLPSVTAILSEASPMPYGLKLFYQNNTKEEADQIFETAGDSGSKLHEAYEKLLLGEELDVLKDFTTEREKKALVAFVDWFRYYKPTEFQSEQSIASKQFKYAGTLDFVGKINGEMWLIDFKTSNAIHMSHQLQVLAYKQAYEESTGIKIDRVGIARFATKNKGTEPKEGKLKESGKGWEFKEVVGYQIEDFMKIYNVYLVLHEGKIPQPSEVVVYPTKLKLLEQVETKK